MKIGIEAQRLFRPKKHGLEIVALELIRKLQEMDKENEYVIFVRKDKDNKCIHPTENFKIREISATSFPDWEQIRLPLALKEEKVDVLHCTANTAPLFTSVPIILTLHDIIFMEAERFKGNYYQYIGNVYRKYLLPRVIKKSQKVLTVSYTEQDNILAHFPESKNRLEVVYNGVNESFKILDKAEVNKTLEQYQLPEKFVLFFGNSASKKNSQKTILGYMEYAKKSTNPIPLVIAGGFKSYIEKLLQQLHAPADLIKVIGYIPFSNQPAIYNACQLFLYTSKRESFGMPIIESMACGTPVVTSKFSCMPEIADAAAVLVDTNNASSIAEGISEVLSDEELYSSLVEKGLIRAQKFHWDDAARKMLSIYQEFNPEKCINA